MKKITVFGGGTGLSCLLSGLKLFPLDVTTVITVTDNGSSTGKLKQELDIPAVGDIGKVLVSMANADDDFIRLMSYRFEKAGSLENHPVRNILLAALIDLKGNLTEAVRYMCGLLQVRGTVLPLTEEKVELVGKSDDRDYFGEEEVSANIRSIRRLAYDHDIRVSSEVTEHIMDADLIIFSPGSLYTSILPHLISDQVKDAIAHTNAPLMYVCNLVTQPGETDGYRVSDHVEVLNRYLGERKIDMVIANSGRIDADIQAKYMELEGKTAVGLDREGVEALGARIIDADIFSIENETIRHNALKTAYLIFSWLMENE